MRELRERVAKSLYERRLAKWWPKRHSMMFAPPDTPPTWDSLGASEQACHFDNADAAMAVIAQDRADRLEARMPEVEAAINEMLQAQAILSAKLQFISSVGLQDEKARKAKARADLLALIRELAS